MKLKCVFIKYHRIERYVHLKKRMILLKRIGIPSMHFHMLLFFHGSSESRCTQTSSWRNNKFLFHNKFYKIFISVFVKMILLLCILYILIVIWSLSWFESYFICLYIIHLKVHFIPSLKYCFRQILLIDTRRFHVW